MAIIVPALLEQDFNVFSARVTEVLTIPDLQRVQIDVLDNTLTPGKTLALAEIANLDNRVQWEAHLMVSNPGDYFSDAKRLGCAVVIVQFESCPVEVLLRFASDLRALGIIPALGVYPRTHIADILPLLKDFDQITLLDVEPGKQGQKIEQNAYARIQELHEAISSLGLHKAIEVDGGITEENIRSVVDAGATLVVSGSAIFDHENRGALHNFLALEQNLS